MASQSSSRKFWIAGGVVAVIGVVGMITFDYPPGLMDTAGTIVPAKRFRADAGGSTILGASAAQANNDNALNSANSLHSANKANTANALNSANSLNSANKANNANALNSANSLNSANKANNANALNSANSLNSANKANNANALNS